MFSSLNQIKSNRFYLRVAKNCLKASLVLHTGDMKENNGKTETKPLSLISKESVKAVWSPVGRPVGGR